jgi:hypothetical protein
MKDKVIEWLFNGRVGLSSKSMASAICDIKLNKFPSHPSDPSDFYRCLKLLEAVPEARNHFSKISKLSLTWKLYIERWDEIESLYNEEVLEDTGKAPRTYKLMHDIQDQARDMAA